MKIPFAKMHGLGNDFVVIDGTRTPFRPSREEAAALGDRYRGIGFDQLLVVENPSVPGVDFDYRIYNHDGGEAGISGNGARCFARFLRSRGICTKDVIRVHTITTDLTLEHLPDGQVRVDAGIPRFEPKDIPFKAAARAERYTVTLDNGAPLEIGAVSVGNPHAVLLVDEVDRAPVAEVGAALQRHPAFPESVNVQFLQLVSEREVRLRIFERGAGETQASGSGATAAAVMARAWGKLAADARVRMPGGDLRIQWDGEGGAARMTGPATHVFDGEIERGGEWQQK